MANLRACLERFVWPVLSYFYGFLRGCFYGLFGDVFRACLAAFMASLRACLTGFRTRLRGCLGSFCGYFICHIWP